MRGRIFISLGILLLSHFFLTSFTLNQKGPREGDMAPEIRLPNANGDTLKLSSLKGHMVLVHFWASWCPTCRAESRKILDTYEEYKDKTFKTGNGLIVLYVSLDDDKDDWLKAIKRDGLNMNYNVSDLNSWQNVAAQTYKINAVPDNFLIDGNGKILDEGSRLTDYLASSLKHEVKK